MIQFGNDKIKEIYVGSDKIKEVYYGSEKVWGGEVDPIQEGYWVHKDTGVKTYFDLDDSSIVDGIMSAPSWRYDCSEVKIPSGVIGLGWNCFHNCPSLTSITLPESVASLEGYCFNGCSSLTSITLPESLTSLGNRCFTGCSSLTSITLPESLTSLGDRCFQTCTYLSLVTSLPTVPPSLGSSAFSSTHANLAIKVPSQSVNAYKAATNWNSYANKISAI